VTIDRRALIRIVARMAAATVCSVALLAFAPRVASPGSGAPVFEAGPLLVAAASPEPSPARGDTRSAGEGPGLVGAPFLAIFGVVALGLLAAGATLLYLRLFGSPDAQGPPGKDRGTRRR
jgi:hypothetical protein